METTIAENRGVDVYRPFRPDADLDEDLRIRNTAYKPGLRPQPACATSIEQGVYSGRWSDGQDLVEVIRRISGTTISMTPLGTGASAVPYIRIGYNVYRNYSGSRIVIQSKNVLIWMNADGGNRVTYTRKDCPRDWLA